jgi:hypothetical protein
MYLIGAELSALLRGNLPDRWMDAIIFLMFGTKAGKAPGGFQWPTGIKAVSRHRPINGLHMADCADPADPINQSLRKLRTHLPTVQWSAAAV